MTLISRPLLSLFQHIAPLCCASCATRYLAGAPDSLPASRAFCAACAPLLESTPYAESCFAYGGPLAEAIRRLKYGDRPELGQRLGRLMVPTATRRFMNRVDLVLPVPLSPAQARKRGYNQSALLARPVAQALKVRCAVNLIRRTDQTPTQVRRGRRERRKLSSASFMTSRNLPSRILLIDDVKTTGTTAAAARASLQHAGVATVYFISLAGRESDPARSS